MLDVDEDALVPRVEHQFAHDTLVRIALLLRRTAAGRGCIVAVAARTTSIDARIQN